MANAFTGRSDVSEGGFLNLNKPAGKTSRDVVNTVQRLAGRKTKVGHAGTLDPLACGVLVVAVGPATRLIHYVQQMPKTYQAEFLLGRYSDTEDLEGAVTFLDAPPVPTEDAIRGAFSQFTGTILQRPPEFSALKVDGRRAYSLARQGQHADLSPREIVIHRIALDGYDYPKMRLSIECGSGTYVRSLGRDLAQSLGTAAVMSALERTAIGPFRLQEAANPASLTGDGWLARMQPPAVAVSHLKKLTLDEQAVRRIQNGQTIRRPQGLDPLADIVALDESGRLVGILTGQGIDELRAKRNFPTQ